MVARVVLNVYDLADTYNSWTYWCGVGVFHSGVEVYGVEYAFGGMRSRSFWCRPALETQNILDQNTFWLTGHDLDISGVFATSPKDAPGPGEGSMDCVDMCISASSVKLFT